MNKVTFDETDDIIDICQDNVFKAVFTKDSPKSEMAMPGFLFNDDEIVHCFEYYDSERQMSLGGRSRIITVELRKLDKIIEKPVEQMTAQECWAVFFRYITDTTKRQTISRRAVLL